MNKIGRGSGRCFDVVTQHKIWIEHQTRKVLAALYSTTQKDWKELLLEGRLQEEWSQSYTPLDHNYILKYSMEGIIGDHG